MTSLHNYFHFIFTLKLLFMKNVHSQIIIRLYEVVMMREKVCVFFFFFLLFLKATEFLGMINLTLKFRPISSKRFTSSIVSTLQQIFSFSGTLCSQELPAMEEGLTNPPRKTT